MNHKMLIPAIAFGLLSLSACNVVDTVNRYAPNDNIDQPVVASLPTVIDEPYRPPCDPTTGYYVADIGRGDAFVCVQPPMRTDCTDGQTLTKAGYFECNQPPETTIPTTDTTPPVR